MALLILKHERWNTKFPRHFNRACSTDEAEELIDGWRRAHSRMPGVDYDWRNIDTDEPVATIDSIDFYAQHER